MDPVGGSYKDADFNSSFKKKKKKRTFFIISVVPRELICLEFPTGGGMCGSATWGLCRGMCVSPEPWTDSVLLNLGSKQDL